MSGRRVKVSKNVVAVSQEIEQYEESGLLDRRLFNHAASSVKVR